MLFPGQGSQYPGMGRTLRDDYPAAAAVFERAGEATGLDIGAICHGSDTGLLATTEYCQIATMTVSYAMFNAFGVEPDAVIGHSSAIFTAAVAAGAIEFEEALVALRECGRALQDVCPAGLGMMAAVLAIPLDVLQGCIDPAERSVVIANVNCPGQYVLSGEAGAVRAVLRRVEAIPFARVRVLPISVASHSPLAEEAANTHRGIVERLAIREPRCAVYVCSEARRVYDAADLRECLWRQFARPVLWESTYQRMVEDEQIDCAVEMGPGDVLTRIVRRIPTTSIAAYYTDKADSPGSAIFAATREKVRAFTREAHA